MARPLARLDEASLVAAASRRTRLEDFGEDGFREPPRILIDALAYQERFAIPDE